ncbi:AAA family ATPase [Tepidicaulis sp. LMO-SS28]|uniref:AAA family ATPase n=1 Tax=Tepidicaulis sp. LMO-SS28 TaxID=3447455 RepID=UPI003EE20C66
MSEAEKQAEIEPHTECNLEWKKFSDLSLHWPDWLIKGILPRNSLICVFGKRGQGKTFLALDWACSIAAENEWLGHQVLAPSDRPNRIVYLLAERPDGLLRRLHGWIKHRHETGDETTTETKGREIFDAGDGQFFFAETPVRIDQEHERNALVENLSKLPPIDLIVVDPMISFMGGSENEARDMQRFIEGLRVVSTELNCSILLVHHEGKKANGARGSSALEAGMDTVLNLKGRNQYQSVIEMTKQRDAAEMEPIIISFKALEYSPEKPLGKFPQIAANAEKEQKQEKKQKKGSNSKDVSTDDTRVTKDDKIILRAIEKLQKSDGATVNAVFAQIEGKIGKSGPTVRRRMNTLCDTFLEKSETKKGKSELYTLTEKGALLLSD